MVHKVARVMDWVFTLLVTVDSSIRRIDWPNILFLTPVTHEQWIPEQMLTLIRQNPNFFTRYSVSPWWITIQSERVNPQSFVMIHYDHRWSLDERWMSRWNLFRTLGDTQRKDDEDAALSNTTSCSIDTAYCSKFPRNMELSWDDAMLWSTWIEEWKTVLNEKLSALD